MILPVIPVVQRHADQHNAVSHTGRHQTAPCLVGEPGFHADHRFIHGEQLVGIGQPPLIRRIPETDLCRGLAADLPERLILHGCRRQQRHVIRRGIVLVVVETGRGDKMGLGHPQLRRLLVHLLRKGGIVPCQFHCRSAGGIVSGRQVPRKKQSIKVLENPKANKKTLQSQKKRQTKMTLTIVAIFAVLLTISYRNSQINEKFNKVQTLKRELSSLQKENEQLKVTIENSLSSNYIEQQAKEKLGMKKLTNKQTVYVTLPKKDYVESPSEKVITKEEKNWFESLVDKIFNK